MSGDPIVDHGDRFWGRVNKSPEAGGCWLWIGCKTAAGYGRMGAYADEHYVHRLSYEHHVGPIPEGLVIDHLCRVRNCVNPDHLEPVTRRENGRRGETPWGDNARKTHCIRGHEFTDDNTYRKPSAPLERQCRVCNRILKERAKELTYAG